MTPPADAEDCAMKSGPLESFLASLRAELSATEVRIVVDNAAATPTGASRGHRHRHEETDRRSQRANRWQTEMSSAHPHLPLEQDSQPPLAGLGPTMPRRRRSLDEGDDRFCQAIRECTIRGGDQRVLRMPQRVCSSELTVDALFPDKKTIGSSSPPWGRSERSCYTGCQSGR